MEKSSFLVTIVVDFNRGKMGISYLIFEKSGFIVNRLTRGLNENG